MDFIGQLAGALGVAPDQAKAVAGTVLGAAKGAVSSEHGDDTAAQLDQAVPELADWQSKADDVMAEEAPAAGGLGGMLGGLASGGGLGALAGAVGGAQAKDIAGVVAVLGKLGIDESKAGLVAPIALQFLKSRLDPGLLSKVLAVAPLLSGEGGGLAGAAGALLGGGGDTAGGLGGALGGLFGKK